MKQLLMRYFTFFSLFGAKSLKSVGHFFSTFQFILATFQVLKEIRGLERCV